MFKTLRFLSCGIFRLRPRRLVKAFPKVGRQGERCEWTKTFDRNAHIYSRIFGALSFHSIRILLLCKTHIFSFLKSSHGRECVVGENAAQMVGRFCPLLSELFPEGKCAAILYIRLERDWKMKTSREEIIEIEQEAVKRQGCKGWTLFWHATHARTFILL